MEAKDQERDLRIHISIVEIQGLAESNKVLKDQVFMLQETLSLGKAEWKRMKEAWQSMTDEAGESSGRMDSKTSKEEGKAVAQTNNQGVKGREEEKGRSTEKTWAQVVSKSAINLGEANIQVNTIQDNEIRERQVRVANIIIKGVRDYGENECMLDLARDFLRDKMLWKGRICQVWRVGKPSDKRSRPIKVTMSSTHDKQILLRKK